jgi:hypothetical protein
MKQSEILEWLDKNATPTTIIVVLLWVAAFVLLVSCTKPEATVEVGQVTPLGEPVWVRVSSLQQ